MDYLLIVALLFSAAAARVEGGLTCIGENGDPVDMFILYKLPHDSEEDDPTIREGKAYAYLDTSNPKFKLGKYAITDKKSPAGRTLNQVYDGYGYKSDVTNGNSSYSEGNTAHIFYNDENPIGHKSYGSYGHTKGALAFDSRSGFWLIHSVPRFPPQASDGYEYPPTGLRYGQSMICVTFNSNMFDKIGLQLIYDHPHIHDNHFPSSFKHNYPNINKLLHRQRVSRQPFTSVVNLQSQAGTVYRHFAKHTRFHKDLYHDFVADDLQCSMLAETWQHGRNIGPSCDGDYTVEDVDELEIQLPSHTVSFTCMNDHSKYAISKSSEVPYVCIGDINRQPSQFKRAGGTLCFKDDGIWRQFNNFITTYNGCE